MKFLGALFLSVFTTLAAQAYYMPQVYFSIQPHAITAQVNNTTGYGLYCQGYVYGQTQNGLVANAWFADFLPPFSYRYAYVYANPPYIFVNAWADIRCQ